jgi:threonylcarbamoyladenosine tRNA methylthiotransferase MtaB
VGFPGETDQEFDATVRFLEAIPLTYLHVFTYSERPTTPAAAFGHQVEPRVRFHRNRILRSLGIKKKRSFQESLVGRTVSILTESDVQEGSRFGFTGSYVRVAIPDSVPTNTVVPVEILRVEHDKCVGRPLVVPVLA